VEVLTGTLQQSRKLYEDGPFGAKNTEGGKTKKDFLTKVGGRRNLGEV